MRRILLCLLAVCGLASAAMAQSGRLPGEMIVHLDKEEALATLLDQWPTSARHTAPPAVQALGTRHPLYLLTFPETTDNPDVLLNWARRQPGVRAAQWNYRLAFRRSPNDTYFSEQWDMDIIQAQEAWEITTGGETALGDEIVVAIMDSGFEPEHPDIFPNLWHNSAENPNDGIDNDGNGYIDDDIGWDYVLDTPMVRAGAHGLGSAGIIGARGNNGEGVAGLNWHIRMMHFSFGTVSQLIRAYEYVIDQRGRYNASNGAEGAFVVVTNASFGQGQTSCDEQPVWAGMYDLLGEVGILTAAGADNAPYDVDQLGDMPSTCPTP
ncbi:MAG: S8 family serine peptidase, partial [Lewinella sp.]|nr:S8 family serine peptidase [Lewinella sp.]